MPKAKNKGHRKELEAAKFKKRLVRMGLTIDDARNPANNLWMFKSHSCPCSCSICSNNKYNRAKNKNG